MSVEERCRNCAEINEIYCRTSTCVNSYSVQWTHDNFSFCKQQQNDWIDSPKFTTGCRSKLNWKLRLYPNTVQSGISYVFVKLVPLFFTETQVSYRLSIIDNEKNKQQLIEADLKLLSRERASVSFRLIERKVLLERKNELLPNDSLTILCELKVVERIVKTLSSIHQNRNAQELSDDLLKLFESSKLSDCTISVRDTEFQVHKSVLSARSKVFAAMFEHEMNESKSNFIKMIDTYPKVMYEVLRYMYTGKFRGLKSMAAEVLPVADKYDLANLKEMCEEALVTQISLEKAVSTLEQADLYNLKKLKAKAIEFMNIHRDEVLKTKAWKALVSNKPELAVEVFSVILEGNIYLKTSGDSGLYQPLVNAVILGICGSVAFWFWYNMYHFVF